MDGRNTLAAHRRGRMDDCAVVDRASEIEVMLIVDGRRLKASEFEISARADSGRVAVLRTQPAGGNIAH